MKIEKIYPNVNTKITPSNLPNFCGTYINMQSLHNYGNPEKKCIIQALKEKNTPLRKFISEVLNTRQFENDMGDCFITLNHNPNYLHLSDIIHFSFPKKHQQALKHTHNLFETDEYRAIKLHKEEMANHIAKKTSFIATFMGSHTDKKQGPEKLAFYIKNNKIVEDLKKHIDEFRHKYLV